ncbi:MAG: hypothetical protein ACYC7D_13675 [Nitrososphaerales archaeon]
MHKSIVLISVLAVSSLGTITANAQSQSSTLTLNPSQAKFTIADPRAYLNRLAPNSPNCGIPQANFWGPGTSCGSCPIPGNTIPAQAALIPCWSSSFYLPSSVPFYVTNSSDNENCPCVVPFAMVGANPNSSGTTTNVPVDIYSITVSLGKTTFKVTSDVKKVIKSPLFKADSTYGMSGPKTQFENAMFRAQWWNDITTAGNTGFNVLLSPVSVGTASSVSVPPSSDSVCTSTQYTQFQDGCGQVYKINGGGKVAVVDPYYFQVVILQQIIDAVQPNPGHLPIFLTSNLVLGDPGNPNNYCCVFGFHGWDQYGPSFNGYYFTFAWASYLAPNILGPSLADINGLSHEIGEWMNDPWTNNVLPYAWAVSNQPQYGCTPLLEVGDPLVGSSIVVQNYHPQDLAFFSWFAQQTPSLAYQGPTSYDFLNVLGSTPPSTTVCN